MTTTINNTLEYILVDAENVQITLSDASLKLNETQAVPDRRKSQYTVAEMAGGRFRRLFNRHHTAYRFFN